MECEGTLTDDSGSVLTGVLVDKNLRWGRNGRIFVSGALAELEIGPSSRNIAGARLAAERIVEAFTGS